MSKLKGKKVIALKETFLNTTLGHSAIIPARIPTRIPPPLFDVAARSGCVDYNPEMANAMVEAMKDAADTASDADVEAHADPKALVREAVRKVMLLGDKSTFTTAGIPKVTAVKVALDRAITEQEIKVEVALDREIVYDVFVELQDVKPETPEAPDLPPADLSDGESGGATAMLERVGEE